jgi:long-chain acyl-CoA synthetase
MAELVQHHAATRAGDAALIDESGVTTWAELDDRVNRAVHALRGLGLGTHDTIALFCGNRREFFEVFLAAAHGGWVVVPVNWHWVADELAYVIQNSGATAVLVDERFIEVAQVAAEDPRTERVHTWVVLDGGTGAVPEGFESYERLLAAAPADPPADTSMGGPMFYTSGTTGFPKGVRSALATTGVPPEVLQLIAGSFTGMLGLPGGDDGGVSLLCGPAYHSAQWVFSMFPLLNGATVVMQHRFDAGEVLELIDRHRVTTVHLVPTQFIRLLRLPAEVRAAFDGSSLRVVYHGAAPCPEQVKRQMLDWWGPIISEYYGGTEAGFVSVISAEEWLRRPGSLGRPVDVMEVAILDDDGALCPPGVPGQVWFRSKLGSDFEYHGDPDKTRQAHRDGGWGTLGDVGFLDAEGYLTLSDRRIDMIISGGVNIYPAEIEGVLQSHPAVADAAVFGIPDDEMGESAMAVVQPVEPGAGSDELAAELLGHVRAHLAGYKVPRRLEFTDALPRTPTGKLLKRVLRDPYWEQAGRKI